MYIYICEHWFRYIYICIYMYVRTYNMNKVNIQYLYIVNIHMCMYRCTVRHHLRSILPSTIRGAGAPRFGRFRRYALHGNLDPWPCGRAAFGTDGYCGGWKKSSWKRWFIPLFIGFQSSFQCLLVCQIQIRQRHKKNKAREHSFHCRYAEWKNKQHADCSRRNLIALLLQ